MYKKLKILGYILLIIAAVIAILGIVFRILHNSVMDAPSSTLLRLRSYMKFSFYIGTVTAMIGIILILIEKNLTQ
jgi:hypothetical protein